MIKILKWLLIVLIILFLVSQGHMISYLLMQGRGQINVLWNAVSIEEFLESNIANDSLRKKAQLVCEIKQFAKQELDLNSDGLYTTIFDQQGEDILWNLTACEPFKLKSKEWNFPLIGKVSYKGFFDLDKAKYEEKILKNEGWDTRIRPVNAWSTLGWFSDPILSKNLKRNEGALAELFIHEITHANVFLKDSVTFNENLASFIGEKGAELFLKQKFGEKSIQVEQYQQSNHDAQLFINQCLKGVSELNQIYNQFSPQMTIEKRSELKVEYIRKWVMQVEELPFFDKKNYHNRFDKELPNNAFFMAFDRYDSKKELFSKELIDRFDNDLKAFIKYYKEQNQ